VLTKPASDGPVLRIGSWPGPSFKDNDFISIFCQALAENGAIVKDVADPRKLDPTTIDVLQLHWAEQVFWRGFGRVKTIALIVETLLAVRRVRKANVPVFWLVHNLKPHDATIFNHILWGAYTKLLSRLVDGFISLSPATLPIIEAHFGSRGWQTNLWIRHPRYPIPDRLDTKKEARFRWHTIDMKLLLVFVGAIRLYKGVESLISAVGLTKDPLHIGAVIAGRVDDRYADELRARVAGASNIEIRARRLEKKEFEGLIRGSDYVVLPFKSTLHSGSIVHALSLGRPVLVPRTPYAKDIADVVGPGWVHLYEGELSAKIIEGLPMPPVGTPDLSTLSPDLAAQRLMNFYKKALIRAKR
jgi:beta-1,4-mannosyltransferase